jgi:hypothetical protein
MALKLAKTNNVGVTTTYHKIVNINADFYEGNVRVIVAHYVDEDYRKKSVSAHAATTPFFFHIDNADCNLREAAYNAMKASDEYKGAEDI